MGKHDAKKDKKLNKKKIGLIILTGVVFIILSIGTYIYFSFRNNSFVKDNKGNEAGNVGDYKVVEGITNVLLVGSDARSLEDNSRADAIIILTIDNINKKLKLTSIMRDSYVKIPGHGEQKINHAYALGGIDLLRDTIQENFKIKLDKYAVINFKGFEKLVDEVGGIEVDVTKEEMNEMNKFIPEVNPKDPHLVKTAGFQKLDGQQALSYVRIRKLGSGDYDRTKRQREVISLIIEKMKEINVLKYPMVASKLMPYFKTNMEVGTMLNYAYTVYKINNFTPEQIQVPVTEISRPEILRNKGWVLLMDISQNAEIINNFIFNDIKYDAKKLDFTSFNKAMSSYKGQISTSEAENLEEDDERLNEKDYHEEIINNNEEDVPKDNEETNTPEEDENANEENNSDNVIEDGVEKEINEGTKDEPNSQEGNTPGNTVTDKGKGTTSVVDTKVGEKKKNK